MKFLPVLMITGAMEIIYGSYVLLGTGGVYLSIGGFSLAIGIYDYVVWARSREK